MPVYSEVLEDKAILQLLKNKYQKILVVGCGACMNESLSYKYDIPLLIRCGDEKRLSYAVFKELERLTNMLNDLGYDARFQLLPEESNSRCMVNYGEESYALLLKPMPDVILVLGCQAGMFGIKEYVGDIPVIKVTKQLGVLAYGYKEQENGTRIILKSKSKVIKAN